MITVSTEQSLLDIAAIHNFLTRESTWAQGIGIDRVRKALANSLCFGAYEEGKQVGFARVITDYATYGYLCDVYVPSELRGRGISRILMDAIMAHPELQGLRRFNLVTTTARGLYEKYGWTPLKIPDSYMERYFPDIYKSDLGQG